MPTLVFFSTIDIHRAVGHFATAIALISVSGVAAYWRRDMLLSRRIFGARLQKLFATAIALVAVSIVVQKLL